MAQNLMRKMVVNGLGFCCVWAFFRAKRRFNSLSISQYLGVSKRAVQLWKHKIREGKCCCEGKPECQKIGGKILPHKYLTSGPFDDD